jgi:hypothetical protein
VAAWVILIGFAIAVVGVIVKVGLDVRSDLREDRGATAASDARRGGGALLIAAVVAVLVLAIVVLPLIWATSARPSARARGGALEHPVDRRGGSRRWSAPRRSGRR